MMRRPRRLPTAALTGVLCGALALGVADALAGLLGPQSSPVVAVGSVVIDLAPDAVVDFGKTRLGLLDKPLLLLGTVVVVLALSAAAGIAVRRQRVLGVALVALPVGLAAAAAVSRPGAAAIDALPVVLGGVCGAAALLWLAGSGGGPVRVRGGSGPVPSPEPVETGPAGRGALGPVPASPAGTGPGRRTAVLGVAGAALVTVTSGRLLAARDGGTGTAAVLLPAPADPASALPAGVQPALPRLTPFVTSNADFYRIDTALAVPRVDPRGWRLRITGMLAQPLELGLDDLLAMPLVERWITLACVSNPVGGPLAGTARWLGVPVRDLLRRVAPAADADMVLSRSVDGFTASTPLAALTDPGRDALVCVGMNGVPLPAEHGFPARMVVPGLYGFVSATKWLTGLELTRFDRASAYWTDRGWSAQAPIRTASRIDVPRPFARVPAGRVGVGGVAMAQHRGIRAVEVRVDDGPWQPARLAPTPGTDTWVAWTWDWDAEPGTRTLRVRATDGSGAVQPEQRRDPKPDGATGWHSVVVTVT